MTSEQTRPSVAGFALSGVAFAHCALTKSVRELKGASGQKSPNRTRVGA